MGARVMGGYETVSRGVIINSSVPPSALRQGDVTRTLAHELVHAYDGCRAAVDWADCAHVACTEVRAANLSGDCDFSVELARRPLGMAANPWAGHQAVCVRRRAELSVGSHAACAGARAREAVDRVWAACYADHAPFSSN